MKNTECVNLVVEIISKFSETETVILSQIAVQNQYSNMTILVTLLKQNLTFASN